MTRPLAASSDSLPTLAALSGHYTLVPAQSRLRFSVRGIAGTVTGTLLPGEGSMAADGSAGISDFELVTPTASLTTNKSAFAAIMRGEDGFFVDKHPVLRFQARDVRVSGPRSFVTTGALSMRGVTQRAVFDNTIVAGEADLVRLKVSGTIDRTTFGMTAGRPLYGREAAIEANLLMRR